MMSYWQNLSLREKGLIGIAFALLVLIVGWAVLLKPLLQYPSEQNRIYTQSQADLIILWEGQKTLANAPLLEKTNLSISETQSIITKSASTQGLTISRRQPNGENGVSLWFENAQSTQFYAWIETLTTSYNITLLRASINRNNDGTIRAQVTFEMGV